VSAKRGRSCTSSRPIAAATSWEGFSILVQPIQPGKVSPGRASPAVSICLGCTCRQQLPVMVLGGSCSPWWWSSHSSTSRGWLRHSCCLALVPSRISSPLGTAKPFLFPPATPCTLLGMPCSLASPAHFSLTTGLVRRPSLLQVLLAPSRACPMARRPVPGGELSPKHSFGYLPSAMHFPSVAQ